MPARHRKDQGRNIESSNDSNRETSLEKFIGWTLASGAWVSLLLAMGTFWIYRPSLTSDFVYDARKEILDEGFITNLANLSDVLSLKVLGMNLMLGARPGQMLYLMLNAALWGKDPFGYHLSSNLLHAVNTALLFLLLLRLWKIQITTMTEGCPLKVQLAAAVAALIFAFHPVAVESVSEVSYSSSLLVTFFTLAGLFAATFFNPKAIVGGLGMAGLGIGCALASVACKESGVALCLLLLVYWLLFRRNERKVPWLLFIGLAMAVTAAFLAARFLFAPSAGPAPLHYNGGSFWAALSMQPRLWVFMMGKLIWPVRLSADYAMDDLHYLSTPAAIFILGLVIGLQMWLSVRSKIGTLGVAVYWLGLVAVSNLLPLFHPLADRYYYLPLAGTAIQVFAIFILLLNRTNAFWSCMVFLFISLVPLGLLTHAREAVFSSNLALWRDTVHASPLSETAHYGLGVALLQNGQVDDSIAQFRTALGINHNDDESYNNLGIALYQKGQLEEAMKSFSAAASINPNSTQAHYNLGLIFSRTGQPDKAVAELTEALRLKPNDRNAQSLLAAQRVLARNQARLR